MSASEQTYDVVVIGGGPGGSSVSSFVAMRGHSVLLLERERFPRYQIGESLLPATINGVCAMLGVTEELKNANFTYKLGGCYRWGRHSEPWSFTFGPSTIFPGTEAFAYQVERMKFDQILLDNARRKGVEVREQHTATGVIRERGRIAGVEYTDAEGNPGTVKARWVVDASGNRTNISRTVGERVYSKFFQNVALFTYFEDGKRLPAPNSGNIFCEAFGEGWFWYIPLTPKLTSVGAVVAREHADKLQQAPEKAMEYFIDQTRIVKDLLAPAHRVTEGPYGQFRIRKDYSYANTRFWTPGAVLVGDAACFIDPIFSSGVHLATYSGLLAARAINGVLDEGLSEERSFQEFELRYRREFSNFYQFLMAFYDMDKDLDSYFWDARKVLNTEESMNDAFIRIVSGTAEDGEPLFRTAREFLESRAGVGDVFLKAYTGASNPMAESAPAAQNPGGFDAEAFMRDFRHGIVEVISQGKGGGRRRVEKPLLPDGLIPSEDGLSWAEPA
ncbi:MAG TPA: tryptophan 7-halogenase [Thermoanaerobaculia bacterium]|jgi:halogenation protein CepH|nr:tryptophan 7-halogenase [Thermoanaerobaculia bacterium]